MGEMSNSKPKFTHKDIDGLHECSTHAIFPTHSMDCASEEAYISIYDIDTVY